MLVAEEAVEMSKPEVVATLTGLIDRQSGVERDWYALKHQIDSEGEQKDAIADALSKCPERLGFLLTKISN